MVTMDKEMHQLVKAITDTPDGERFPASPASYNKMRDTMMVVDRVPTYGRRIIIPAEL